MGEHDYVSTACQHQLHQQCRRTCKFCPAGCHCVCHGTRERSHAEQAAGGRVCYCRECRSKRGDHLSRVDPYDSTKGQCADPWHDGVGVEEHQACPRCGDPYRWSCCGSADPEHLPSRCGIAP